MLIPFLAEFRASRVVGASLSGAAAAFLLGWLRRAAQRESVESAGSHCACFPKAMRIFVIVLWLLTAGFIALMGFFVREATARDAILVGLFFGSLTLVLHLEAFGTRVTWDDRNIYTKSPWRRRRIIPFAAVRACDFSQTLQWYRIYTEDQGIIRLHTLMRGVPELLSALPCDVPEVRGTAR